MAAGIGGSAPAEVLCEKEREQCGIGPEGSIEVPDSVRQKAVNKFLHG